MNPAVPALVAGLLFAWLVGQAYYPLVLRTAQPEDTPPPDAPERDPDWCHTHNKHKKDEEQ